MLPAGRPLPLRRLVELGDQRAHQLRQRAGLAARTISELLRGSTRIVVRNDASAVPGAAPAHAGRAGAAVDQALHQRRQVGGDRVRSGITSTSAALRHVERRDDARQPPQVVGVVGDHQRVVARVDVDRVVRR